MLSSFHLVEFLHVSSQTQKHWMNQDVAHLSRVSISAFREPAPELTAAVVHWCKTWVWSFVCVSLSISWLIARPNSRWSWKWTLNRVKFSLPLSLCWQGNLLLRMLGLVLLSWDCLFTASLWFLVSHVRHGETYELKTSYRPGDEGEGNWN